MPRKQAQAEFQARLKALREAKALSQEQLAQAVGVVRPVITRAESGEAQSDGLLVKLGNFAADVRRYDDAIWFWQHAGVRVEGMVPAAMQLLKKLEAPIVQGSIASIPASKLVEQPGQKGRDLLFQSALLPNPIAASYVAIPDDSLLPMFKRGDVLLLDESEMDIWKMIGSFVAMRRHTRKLERVEALREKFSDAEFAQYPELSRSPDRMGTYAGWLRANVRGENIVVTLEAPGPLGGMSSEVVAFAAEPVHGGSRRRKAEVPEFSVLGRVIAWVDMGGKSLPGHKEEAHASTAKKKNVKAAREDRKR